MIQNKEYFSSMRTILYVIKIFGIFPFISLHSGSTLWLMIVSKILTTLSVVAYVTVFFIEFLYVCQIGYTMVRYFDLTTFVRSGPIITSRLFIMLFPLFAWNQYEKIHDYWNNWMYYQKRIEKVTKVQYSSPVRKQISKLCLFALLGTCSVTWLIRNRFPHNFVINANILTITYIMIAWHSIPIYWYANCMFIKSMAKVVIRLVQESANDGSEKKLERSLQLWLGLCDLNAQFNFSHSILFPTYFAISIINIIGSLYSSLTSYVLEDDESASLTYLLSASVSVAGIIVFCESAHSVSTLMNKETEEIILSSNTIHMNERLLSSVLFCLHVIEVRKAEINLNGFMSLKRLDIASIAAAVINYLIILKQFSNL